MGMSNVIELPEELQILLVFKKTGQSELTCMFCNRERCPNIPEYETSYRRVDGARVTMGAHSHCLQAQPRVLLSGTVRDVR